MSIGFGIFLVALGAILTFALNVEASWVDLDMVGWILMAAGLVVTIIGIALLARKRQQVTRTRTSDGVSGRDSVTERSSTDDRL